MTHVARKNRIDDYQRLVFPKQRLVLRSEVFQRSIFPGFLYEVQKLCRDLLVIQIPRAPERLFLPLDIGARSNVYNVSSLKLQAARIRPGEFHQLLG